MAATYCDGAAEAHSTYAETIHDPSHPYFTGAFAPAAHALTEMDFAEWGSTDAGHIEGAPAGAAVLLSNSQGPSLTEYALGEGWVVVSTLTYGWGENGARTAAMDNMLLYAAMQVRGSENPASLPVSGVPEPSTFLLLATGAVLVAFSQGLRRY